MFLPLESILLLNLIVLTRNSSILVNIGGLAEFSRTLVEVLESVIKCLRKNPLRELSGASGSRNKKKLIRVYFYYI